MSETSQAHATDATTTAIENGGGEASIQASERDAPPHSEQPTGLEPSEGGNAHRQPAPIESYSPQGQQGSGILSSAATPPSPQESMGVAPSQCQCSGSGVNRQYAYVIGILGYDFGTEAGRDGFAQMMPYVNQEGTPITPGQENDSSVQKFPPNPYDVRQMVNYLYGVEKSRSYEGYKGNPSEAKELIWTFNQEMTPLYGIQPSGSFSEKLYEQLICLLRGQTLDKDDDDYIERVSMPGSLTSSSVRLYSGQMVPVLQPQIRGLYGWATKPIADELASANPGHSSSDAGGPLEDFLNRIYYDLANLGQSSSDRALNYAATNAFQAYEAFVQAAKDGLTLDTIQVEKSRICRMDSDCWDVKLRFFNPENVLKARTVFRFTVDVSAEFPVTLGAMRKWAEA